MSRIFIGRVGALIFTILFWVWFLTQRLFSIIGATTVVDDFNLMVDRLPKWIGWFLETPWWVPAMLATLLTIFLIWLSIPKRAISTNTGSPQLEVAGKELQANEGSGEQTEWPPDRFYCEFSIEESGIYRLGEIYNFHDMYVSHVEFDGEKTLLVCVQFLVPFHSRVRNITATKPNGEIVDLLGKFDVLRHTERNEILALDDVPVPCVVRINIAGIPYFTG